MVVEKAVSNLITLVTSEMTMRAMTMSTAISIAKPTGCMLVFSKVTIVQTDL